MPRAFDTAALASFVTCTHTSHVHPPGTILFREGDLPDGVHLLESGKAKLHGSTSRGKTIILKIAQAGELLGLNAAILGKPYLFSSETIEPSRVSHVTREDFLEFLDKSPDAAAHVIEQLSRNYYEAQWEVRTLSLASSATEKVARLLIGWVDESDGKGDDDVWVSMDLTHEDVAQMIGVTRETVSRVLSSLSRKGVVEVKGRALRIPSVARLRELGRL